MMTMTMMIMMRMNITTIIMKVKSAIVMITPDNGRNNALRINGLGAPRGFYTPMLRQINFPTTKYGEDYAVGLRVSREYQIGRIYDVVYNCRRWDDNSDANVDIEGMNRNNLYKDRIRTWELKARIQRNKRS